MSDAVLITAAGSSQRFGEKKEYLPLNAGVNQHTADTHTTVLSAAYSVIM